MTDAPKPGEQVDSTSDARTINNVMRHEYVVLTDAAKADMKKVKDLGLELHTFFDSLGVTRELSAAKTKVEEAVFWAVKHITSGNHKPEASTDASEA